MLPKGIKQLIVNKSDYIKTINENKRLADALHKIADDDGRLGPEGMKRIAGTALSKHQNRTR